MPEASEHADVDAGAGGRGPLGADKRERASADAGKRAFSAAGLPDVTPRGYSHAVAVGELIWCAGQVGEGATAEQQARAAFGRVERLLAEAGATLADVVKLTIYVTDASAADTLARLRVELLPQPFPAATLVVVAALGRPELLVEVDVTAVRGAGAGR